MLRDGMFPVVASCCRVVNALLTQIDALKQYPNVMVLTTTNITQAIDLAFVDRADIKVPLRLKRIAAYVVSDETRFFVEI